VLLTCIAIAFKGIMVFDNEVHCDVYPKVRERIVRLEELCCLALYHDLVGQLVVCKVCH